MNKLTTLEITRLEKLEATIKSGQQVFVEVGAALTEIRDKKLYRDEFNTFEFYCQSRWGWSRQHASNLIQSSAAVSALPKTLAATVPNEWAARELAKLSPETAKEIVRELKAEKIPVSANAISEKAENIAPSLSTVVDKPKITPVEKPAKTPQRKDHVGFPIPTKILLQWDRADSEAKGALARISEVIAAVKDAKESEDVIYGELSKRWQDLLINLENVKSDLKRVVPYAVCTNCQGQIPCRECFGKGFVSKMFWDESVPQEFKDLRKKSAEKKK